MKKILQTFIYRALTVGALSILSVVTHAAVTINMPATNTSGTYVITWSGGRQTSTLYEYRSSSPIQLATGTNNGTYTVTGKPSGTYYYYVRDCVSWVNTCDQTPNKMIVVTIPSSSSSSSSSSITGNVSEVYEYDALGRLVKFKVNNSVKTSYDYDKAGNRTTVTE